MTKYLVILPNGQERIVIAEAKKVHETGHVVLFYKSIYDFTHRINASCVVTSQAYIHIIEDKPRE